VAKLRLSEPDLAKIDRYLDVTRSALLFSRRVLLVEGLAEALLVPVFGELAFKGNHEALARLRAATIVAIDGVDFEPYVQLLLTPCPLGGQRIADRVAIVTDEDPVRTPHDTSSAGAARKETLVAVATAAGASASLLVELSPITLEATLMGTPSSPTAQDVLRQVFLEGHPRSAETWKTQVEDAPTEQRAEAFRQLLVSTRTRKGDFAQRLAARARHSGFPVPPQFGRALRFLFEK
jgi:putative ATP-dependent endonuclease of OLD family